MNSFDNTEDKSVTGQVSSGGVPPSGVPPSGVPPSGVPPSGVPPSGVPPSGVPPIPDPTGKSDASSKSKSVNTAPDSPKAPGTPDLFPDHQDKSKPDSAAVLHTVRNELASILKDLDPDSR